MIGIFLYRFLVVHTSRTRKVCIASDTFLKCAIMPVLTMALVPQILNLRRWAMKRIVGNLLYSDMVTYRFCCYEDPLEKYSMYHTRLLEVQTVFGSTTYLAFVPPVFEKSLYG